MENAALLSAIVKNAIDGIITIDDLGTIESINPAACKLFDYFPEEVVGKNIAMLMPSPHAGKHDQYLKNYKTTGKPSIIGVGRELVGLRKDGYQFPMKLGVSEVQYAGRAIFAGFIHDLTQQKLDEERLKNYASHLEELVEERTKSLNDTIEALQTAKEKVSHTLEKQVELSRLKNRFLAMASHEFRTPLSSIQLSVSLIEKYFESGDGINLSKHLFKIKNSVTSLTAILNDFLYVDNLEAGKVSASNSHFDLVEFAEGIIEEMQLLAKGNQNIIFAHSGIRTKVYLDKNLLRNCVTNLITNAIKYSGDTCCIDLKTQINDQGCTVTVHDDGIGIPLENQEHLFEAFYRANNTGNIPGTGLGLNIVARYVVLMKGTAHFTSSQAQGTLFTLTFPIS
ncbi:PAS domain-containing sensor histidine kinase [Flavobacterium noncentrifugens]|uniref:Sensor protein FixL n=1 Tax=Flavobacterium noncentrifugens TaxID=1128970 RepID=A0A1G8WX22_9FLAO|nr:PAS domain-containing sensor histidine kinase [Flavobacterium noncentrifugens]GEP51086.1 PAS domain-containing sensor histidine kinase [Flavobacterium noncentrifugens]SDJ82909.1 PAS domain S-box-containing protein [Flavobacterium noncentrifugens]